MNSEIAWERKLREAGFQLEFLSGFSLHTIKLYRDGKTAIVRINHERTSLSDVIGMFELLATKVTP